MNIWTYFFEFFSLKWVIWRFSSELPVTYYRVYCLTFSSLSPHVKLSLSKGLNLNCRVCIDQQSVYYCRFSIIVLHFILFFSGPLLFCSHHWLSTLIFHFLYCCGPAYVIFYHNALYTCLCLSPPLYIKYYSIIVILVLSQMDFSGELCTKPWFKKKDKDCIVVAIHGYYTVKSDQSLHFSKLAHTD